MSATNRREELQVYIMARGIKKRCRKISREMIKLPNQPLTVDKAPFVEIAVRKISEVMKTCDLATLHFDHVEVSEELGYKTSTWQMFDPRHTKLQILGPSNGVH